MISIIMIIKFINQILKIHFSFEDQINNKLKTMKIFHFKLQICYQVSNPKILSKIKKIIPKKFNNWNKIQ